MDAFIPDGWLLVNKPKGITSSDLVVRVRRRLLRSMKNQRRPSGGDAINLKVGHTGTLDPMASGLMLLAIGKATRLVEFAICSDKQYTFTITWGSSTDSYDAEGKVVSESSVRPTRPGIDKSLDNMIGPMDQIPPKYSAIKIGGKRACDLVRCGANITLSSRQVILYKASIVAHDCDSTTISIHCSKGFYVRSLARDLADALGAEGHVSYLHRDTINKFSVANASPLEYIENMDDIGSMTQQLMPIEAVLDDITVLHLSEGDARSVCHGRPICVDGCATPPGDKIAVFYNKALLAICNCTNGVINPIKVLSSI